MCPIVPTFTCGLLRSNFSFAIALCLSSNDKFLSTSHADPVPATPTRLSTVHASEPGLKRITSCTARGLFYPTGSKFHRLRRVRAYSALARNYESKRRISRGVSDTFQRAHERKSAQWQPVIARTPRAALSRSMLFERSAPWLRINFDF